MELAPYPVSHITNSVTLRALQLDIMCFFQSVSQRKSSHEAHQQFRDGPENRLSLAEWQTSSGRPLYITSEVD